MHSFPQNTCQFERLGNNYENTTGPDIGFIRLPDDIAAQPTDEAIFYNITKRYNNARINEGQVRAPLSIHALAGVIGQASDMVEQLDHSTEVKTTMLVSQVAIFDRREHLDMDYYEVRVGNVERLPKPTSYQGVSGGPLFATKEGATIDERLLIGVAFRQSEPDENGERTVFCHGWKSIYDTMCPIITLAYADPATFIQLNDLNPDGTPQNGT
ncbi:hypothetical protein [Neorhizobium galegae]|uniref:hypothetical protein n=1 Tax=Neorhizobium galegae TaxID=399 RepID=UPI0006217B8E